MSTKIYTAYRMKTASHLFDVVETIKRRGQENAKAKIREWIEALASSLDGTTEEFVKSMETFKSERATRIYLASRTVSDGYRERQGKLERDLYNFDVMVGVHEYKGSLYFIPYADMLMSRVLDFMAELPGMDEFSYWNNTDAPETVSRRAWLHRERVWNAIDDNGWGMRRIDIDVVSYDGYWQINPWMEMLQEERESRLGAPA